MKKTRILAILLAALMLLSALPVVYAAGIPTVEKLRINTNENGECDGAFEL